jgi:hypothetical protein
MYYYPLGTQTRELKHILLKAPQGQRAWDQVPVRELPWHQLAVSNTLCGIKVKNQSLAMFQDVVHNRKVPL